METSHDEWLERHTFACAAGRISPAQCRVNRARITIAEWVRGEEKAFSPEEKVRPKLFKSGVCEECTEWEGLITSFETRQNWRVEEICPSRPMRERPTGEEETNGEGGKSVGSKTDGGTAERRMCSECGEKPQHCRGLCEQCYRRMMAQRRAVPGLAGATDGGTADKPGKAQVERERHAKTVESSVMRVDFARYPHLLEGLRQRAETELRTVPNQLLWELAGRHHETTGPAGVH